MTIDHETEVDVSYWQICQAINRDEFRKYELSAIKSAIDRKQLYSSFDVPDLWKEQWEELMVKIAKKCPNPLEFEQKLSQIMDLD